MQPYLIRPRIEADESIYSHLLRSARANLVSPNRMAHSLGLIHHYQLKPTHYQTLSHTEITQAYESRLKIEPTIIQNKIIMPVHNIAPFFVWHGLFFNESDLRRSPRKCPACIAAQPDLIREQWYIEPYQICHRHQCYMATGTIEHSQSLLPFTTDLLTEFSLHLDQVFSYLKSTENKVKKTQSLLNLFQQQRPKDVITETNRATVLWTPKQLSLFNNKTPKSCVSY